MLILGVTANEEMHFSLSKNHEDTNQEQNHALYQFLFCHGQLSLWIIKFEGIDSLFCSLIFSNAVKRIDDTLLSLLPPGKSFR